MTTSRVGRPAQYSREQLTAAVGIIEARGQAVLAPSVKTVLCGEFAISTGLNIQSLARELDDVLADRAEARRREAVAMLPEAAVAAVHSQVSLLERELLGTLGRLRADLAHDASKEAAARAAECRHLAARCDELERTVQGDAERFAELDRDIAALITERDAALARAGAAEAEARAFCEREAARGSMRDEVRAEVARVLAALGRSVGPDESAHAPVAPPSSRDGADLGLLEAVWPSRSDARACDPTPTL